MTCIESALIVVVKYFTKCFRPKKISRNFTKTLSKTAAATGTASTPWALYWAALSIRQHRHKSRAGAPASFMKLLWNSFAVADAMSEIRRAALPTGVSPGQKNVGWTLDTHMASLGPPAASVGISPGRGWRPPEAENLSALGCQTEAINSPHFPLFANWRVKLQT